METFNEMRERSQKRKQLISQTLGVSGAEELGKLLGREQSQEPESKKKANGESVKTAETTDTEVYKDSSTFLKGTQSANPHNDYCQHFVDTGQRPQNFIRDVGLADRFEEYPKLKELIRLKDEQISKTATPPMYLKADLRTFDLKELGTLFDVILIEPPLEEYSRTHGITNLDMVSWEDIIGLNISEIMDIRGFVFIWCGSSQGLDK